MFSKNISIEYNDSEAAENDKEEKEYEEDDLNEFTSLHYEFTQDLIQSKLYVIAALVKLEQPTILLEFPPPNI